MALTAILRKCDTYNVTSFQKQKKTSALPPAHKSRSGLGKWGWGWGWWGGGRPRRWRHVPWFACVVFFVCDMTQCMTNQNLVCRFPHGVFHMARNGRMLLSVPNHRVAILSLFPSPTPKKFILIS